MNILSEFLANAPRFGGRTAIIEKGGAEISFSAIARRSAMAAASFARSGIGKGDRVLIAMPLSIDLYVGMAALWRLGAVAVFPEPALGLKGLRHAAHVTGPKAFLTGGWMRLLRYAALELYRIPCALHVADDGPAGDACADPALDDPALISFTSGSTGMPKAIVRSHGFLAAQNARVAELIAPRRPDEIDLVAFPVFVIANLALGITSVLPIWNLRKPHEARSADIMAQLHNRRVTRLLAPPSICETLSDLRQPLPLDTIFTGGGPVFPDMIERLLQASPQLDLVSVYGSTEAEPIAHLHASNIGADDWQAMKSGQGLLAGSPVPAISLQLDHDEIIVTGDHVNKGYLDPAQDVTTKINDAGQIWHRTGDAGRLDSRGRLWLLGRKGGEVDGFHPFCIETTARFWPGVRRAALVAIGSQIVLAIEGAAAHMPAWTRQAADIGPIKVVHVARMPLDARHRSKVDVVMLRKLVEALHR
jgi:olefin beta-lactone synthetase